ncbi:MAG: N-acetyltransferase [Bryobacterales bacterium]|nr:N-acetyltransferase [Bryobacterales bacterium]
MIQHKHPEGVRIHPTAMIEDEVRIGARTSVWDNVHIRHHAVIGEQCIIGEKSYIAYDVVIGNRVKINAFVYICTGVTLEDGVMLAAGTIFTNDRFPRATTPDLRELRDSGPDEHTLLTRVKAGASIGAGSIIGCNLTVGRFAMVGMGTVVTKSVPDYYLVIGQPARPVGIVCKCGPLVHRFTADPAAFTADLTCPECGERYHVNAGVVTALSDAAAEVHG